MSKPVLLEVGKRYKFQIKEVDKEHNYFIVGYINIHGVTYQKIIVWDLEFDEYIRGDIGDIITATVCVINENEGYTEYTVIDSIDVEYL